MYATLASRRRHLLADQYHRRRRTLQIVIPVSFFGNKGVRARRRRKEKRTVHLSSRALRALRETTTTISMRIHGFALTRSSHWSSLHAVGGDSYRTEPRQPATADSRQKHSGVTPQRQEQPGERIQPALTWLEAPTRSPPSRPQPRSLRLQVSPCR